MLKWLSRLFFKPTVAGAVKPLTDAVSELDAVIEYTLEEIVALDAQIQEIEIEIKEHSQEQNQAMKYRDLIKRLLNS